MVRFHFFSFSSPTNLSTAKFNVSVPGFSLLQNFDAKNTTKSPLVKEYYVKINITRFKITFTPQNSSFAFVNAIELFMLPVLLIPDSIARFNYNDSTGRYLSNYRGGLPSRALETKHRLNVRGETVTRNIDTLSRKWLPDDIYITNPQNARNSSFFGGTIKRTADHESDGPDSNQYIAPDIIYQTAKESKNGSNDLSISWSVPVEKNIDHFLRLHFCDIFNQRPGLATFFLLIYDSYVMIVHDEIGGPYMLRGPYYYDFVVRSDDSGLLKITLKPDTLSAFLNGLEVMKVIDPSGIVNLDDLNTNLKISLPVVVVSILGGLVLVSVMLVLFLWISKIRKQRPVENSDLLEIPAAAGGISHCRLTYGKTTQGSLLPNTNLGLNISLHDLQLATEDFDAKRIIGKGGFGNVYKGVLKNGMNVAVKRSVPGSGQGYHEFQTEVMVLSKIRHIHLVSLIGYCDERCEMILVYDGKWDT